MQLGADLRVAVCSDDAGGEEGVAVSLNNLESIFPFVKNDWVLRDV